ncbi:transcriptional regulator, LysR family [Shewanella halifaxensis HAW-EB4]|uniref:Transcriptional regulator, LysR family n=1 Tax=Shewanella halifaxensis (strain HAW-EB4) TaxID=458817 RepID=B0TJE1_SHEHH|nr:LysR family transcriptional regulator [Shewanella halifaxensis]ABZ75732.1 transcriptional regulator, LysR family [Shewanella halifaxensis HAW-EB4]
MKRNISDLNQIGLLLDLVHTKNMSRTAQRLGKTTSAISKNLQRLREELCDPLFIRQLSGLEPTTYTLTLAAKLSKIQKDIDAAFDSELFAPKLYRGKITLAANVALLHYYQPKLLITLLEQAPLANFEIVQWQEDSYQKILDGSINAGLHFLNENCTQSITQYVVQRHEIMLMTGAKHSAITASEALLSPLAILKIHGWNTDAVRFSRYLYQREVEHSVRLQCEDLGSLFACLEYSDSVSPLPSFLSYKNLKALPLDERGNEISSVVCIPSTHRNEPLYQWLVALIKSLKVASA